MRSPIHRCPNPSCRAILEIPEKLRGKHARCAKCGHSFFVPIMLQLPPGRSSRIRKAG